MFETLVERVVAGTISGIIVSVVVVLVVQRYLSNEDDETVSAIQRPQYEMPTPRW